MSCQPMQQLFNAERRQYTERRRVCLLEYAPGEQASCDARSGFDRRLAIRIQCLMCGKLLFATRDAERPVILSDRFFLFASKPAVSTYLCPCCGAAAERCALQQQQEELLKERVRFE
jgi:hypothetical protein